MPTNQSSTPLLPILIIIAVIAGGLFFLFKPQQKAPITPDTPRQENSSQTMADNGEISDEHSEAAKNRSTSSGEEQTPLLRQAPMEAALTNPCLESTQRLDLFFSYLDEQEYIQRYQFPHDSKEMISTFINTLLESPPVINRKGLNSVDIVSNSAHIYRTLGAQNLNFLLKTINNEADLMEETCSSFYEWFDISTQCLNHSYPLHPRLENLYEYASFLMETTGGRAYLARRKGNLRLLAQYYSVLIINEAEQQGLNKYNVNLASLLPHLIGEIEESDELAAKRNYLSTLYDIRAHLPDRSEQQ